MDLHVRFWGTRGSIPTPGYQTRRFGGNTSCVEIVAGDTTMVCDAGTGIRELGMALLNRSPGPVVVHLFFSHMHWDHIQGFPFFVPAYAPANTINVYEIAPGDHRVKRLLHSQMRSEYFPVGFSDLGSQIVGRHFDEGGRTMIGAVAVSCFEQIHPGGSFAYAFECEGKKIVYATDNEIDLALSNADRVAQHPEELRQSPPDFVRFVAGANLLIVDSQYTDAEYAGKVGWGHPRANTVVDLAIQAGVGQCALFHHDPLHDDDAVNQIVEAGRQRVLQFGAAVSVFGAREGLELRI